MLFKLEKKDQELIAVVGMTISEQSIIYIIQIYINIGSKTLFEAAIKWLTLMVKCTYFQASANKFTEC